MGSTVAYAQLMAALTELRRAWKRRQLLIGALQTLTIAAGLLLIGTLIDTLFRVSDVGRVVIFLGMLLGCVGALLNGVVRPLMEDRRDDFFAMLIEEKHPELRNRLINALQLGRANEPGQSEVLVDRIVHDAAQATSEIEVRSSLEWDTFRRVMMRLGVVVAMVTVASVLIGPRWLTAMQRLLLPWQELPPFTATRILDADVQPGDTRVPENDPVMIRVQVQGEIPAEAELIREAADGTLQRVPMQVDAENPARFRAALTGGDQSYRYRIVAGDGQSRWFEVTVIRRPQIVALHLTERLPDYAGATETVKRNITGEIAAIPGTRITLEMESSKPLKSAQMRLRGELPPIAMTSAGDAKRWSASFVIWASDATGNPIGNGGDALPVVVAPTDYQIRILDTDGIANYTESTTERPTAMEPLWRPIQRLRDGLPTVTLVMPGDAGAWVAARDQRLMPGQNPTLAIEARDDRGLDSVAVMGQIADRSPQVLMQQPIAAGIAESGRVPIPLDLAKLGAKPGERVLLWGVATDRNSITGPGRSESRKIALTIVATDQLSERLKVSLGNFIVILEELIRLQSENRTQTQLARPADELAEAKPGKLFAPLIRREMEIRRMTNTLARTMEQDALRIPSLIVELDGLHRGPMAEVQKLLEQAADSQAMKAIEFKEASLPIQDRILESLKGMLARLQKNEEARKTLTRLSKEDKAAHQKLTEQMTEIIKNLNTHVQDATELASGFERLPKKQVDELKEEKLKAMNELEEFTRRTKKWTEGSVNEMTKLGNGFVDDFGMRKDVNRIYEEIEAKARGKAEKLEVAAEDLGVGLATKMKEDLEMWLPDAADSVKWVQEEPIQQKPLNVPEMPLPDKLQDLIGDLLQKADEFDEEADDVTSAWMDNLDQAGWGVSDGPISSFSAKGKTGNDQPNNHEVSGRSGDGRRGKSSGQMVGDTARALPGRKTPARVGNERYEPGQLKQEGQQDPGGATGGGKKAGAGRQGLQGGTPPDITKDLGRLNAKQAGMREKMENVARKLEEQGYSSVRIREAMELMKAMDQDLRDRRYDDAARKRQDMLQSLRSAAVQADPTRRSLSNNRNLPPELRDEILQSSEDGYPAGYEELMRNYFQSLSNSPSK
ncbi:DUF3488 domain-containing protein [Tuwongella immobilis]|uniref:Marine sediment metagenome DNA, contig: S01H4_L01017 n=1 Tax=Tuwongella immobilis TaxID=692036 RepID=A0A6C2YMG8_9BACT